MFTCRSVILVPRINKHLQFQQVTTIKAPETSCCSFVYWGHFLAFLLVQNARYEGLLGELVQEISNEKAKLINNQPFPCGGITGPTSDSPTKIIVH